MRERGLTECIFCHVFKLAEKKDEETNIIIKYLFLVFFFFYRASYPDKATSCHHRIGKFIHADENLDVCYRHTLMGFLLSKFIYLSITYRKNKLRLRFPLLGLKWKLKLVDLQNTENLICYSMIYRNSVAKNWPNLL